MNPDPLSPPFVPDPVEAGWIAFVPLPILATRFAPPSRTPSESEAEIRAWLDGNRNKLNESDDTPEPTAQQEFESWDEPTPPSRMEVRAKVWSRWIDKLVRVKRAEGHVAVWMLTPNDEQPRPPQTAALRHLIEHEAAIDDAIRQALQRSSEYYGGDADQQPARFVMIRVHADGHDGFAPIQVTVECDWELEHGMNVVYHPRTGADWATADGVDDLVAEAGPEPPPAPPPSPEDELVTAIYMKDEAKIAELQGQGVKAEPQYTSALFAPIHQRDVEGVRRLLELGADPNRRDSYEGSPLEAARRALAQGTLQLPKRAPWWMKLLTTLIRTMHGRHVRRERRNGEAIIALLKAAGAR